MKREIVIPPGSHDLLKALHLDTPEAIFSDARLRVWRDLEDRDNSTLDATRPDGSPVRLHVKRDKWKRREPMALEAAGILLLNEARLQSAPLVAHGCLGDRTFVITENLDGFSSTDRLLETDVDRVAIFEAIFRTAAALHDGGLHHRDLYANHFYCRPSGTGFDIRLIDCARVRRLPSLFRERWIVKDVGQLVFSITPYLKDPLELDYALRGYHKLTRRLPDGRFDRRVRAKAAWIDRHDRALRARKPQRNLRLADGN